MWQWIRRSFVTGLLVTGPLAVSVVALVWVFQLADAMTSGLGERLVGRHIPGLGLITTALVVLGAGALARNVIGRRILDRGEALLLHVPVFKTIYAPIRQLVSAFAPDNAAGFKRVVLVEDPSRGFVLGFLTKEFAVDRGQGLETLLAVYVPTNHLYLGDIVVCRPDRVSFPDVTVEQGITIFLTGGMALPTSLAARERPRGGAERSAADVQGPVS